MNTNPFNKRNLKNAPPRSDSSQKSRQFQEKHRPKQHTTQPHVQGGGGGHTSERENQTTQQTEPENDPDSTPFIPKGALMHTKNRHHEPPLTTHLPRQDQNHKQHATQTHKTSHRHETPPQQEDFSPHQTRINTEPT